MARWQPGKPGPEVGKRAGCRSASRGTAGNAGSWHRLTVGGAGYRARGKRARGHAAVCADPYGGGAPGGCGALGGGSGPVTAAPGGSSRGVRARGPRVRGRYTRRGSSGTSRPPGGSRPGGSRSVRRRRRPRRLCRELGRGSRCRRRRSTAEVVGQPGEVDAREVHGVLPRVLGLIPRLRWPRHSYILPPSGDSLIVVSLPGILPASRYIQLAGGSGRLRLALPWRLIRRSTEEACTAASPRAALTATTTEAPGDLGQPCLEAAIGVVVLGLPVVLGRHAAMS